MQNGPYKQTVPNVDRPESIKYEKANIQQPYADTNNIINRNINEIFRRRCFRVEIPIFIYTLTTGLTGCRVFCGNPRGGPC